MAGFAAGTPHTGVPLRRGQHHPRLESAIEPSRRAARRRERANLLGSACLPVRSGSHLVRIDRRASRSAADRRCPREPAQTPGRDGWAVVMPPCPSPAPSAAPAWPRSYSPTYTRRGDRDLGQQVPRRGGPGLPRRRGEAAREGCDLRVRRCGDRGAVTHHGWGQRARKHAWPAPQFALFRIDAALYMVMEPGPFVRRSARAHKDHGHGRSVCSRHVNDTPGW